MENGIECKALIFYEAGFYVVSGDQEGESMQRHGLLYYFVISGAGMKIRKFTKNQRSLRLWFL